MMMDGRYRRGHAAAAAEKFTRKTFERALLPPLRSRTLVSIPCLSEKSQSGKHHQLKPKRPVDSTSSTDGSPRATIANLFKLFLFVQPHGSVSNFDTDVRCLTSVLIPVSLTRLTRYDAGRNWYVSDVRYQKGCIRRDTETVHIA